jgi:hypothetical protein
VDKQKTAAELEEIVRRRIGAGDYKVTVHANPETGWHATIYGRQPAEVHRCQVMAETIVVELCQHYGLAEKSRAGARRHLIFRFADFFRILVSLNRTGQAGGLFNVFGGLMGLAFGLRRLRPFGSFFDCRLSRH